MKNPNTKNSFLVCLSAIALFTAPSLSAQTVQLTPDADAFINSRAKTTGHGNFQYMRVFNDELGDADPYHRLAYIRFNVSDSSIVGEDIGSTSLTFRFYPGGEAERPTNRETTMLVYGLSADYQAGLGQNWAENSLTYNNAPLIEADVTSGVLPSYIVELGTFVVPATSGLAPGDPVTFTSAALTDFLKDSLSSSATHNNLITFILFEEPLGLASGEGRNLRFAAKENTQGYDPTTLSITVIPEPSVVGMATGFGALVVAVGMRRRRRAQ